MREIGNQNLLWIGYFICAAAFAFSVWSFYPGLMTPDSIANLTQGRKNSFSDINAPLMSYLWGWLDSIVAGPALIFVIHLAIFWSACALFWRSTNVKSFWLGIALVLFGLAPHMMAQTVVVWKDVALGVSLLVTVALLNFAKATKSRIGLLISPLFLFYGLAARLNAFPAVLPIAIWTAWVAAEVFEIRRRNYIVFLGGAMYFLALSVSVTFVDHRLTQGRTEYPFQQVILYDLAAISVEKDESLFPDYIRENQNYLFETVRSRYNERSVSDLIFPNVPNAGDVPPLKLTQDAAEIRQLRSSWIAAVLDNPFSYLRHKARVFATLIGLGRSTVAPYVSEGFASNPAEFRGDENFGYFLLMTYFGAFRRPFPQTFFFRAVIWMVLCSAMGFAALRRRLREDWDLVFVLSASSLLFVLAYFPSAPSTEFRYLFWPAIASAIAVIFGVFLLRREKVEQAV